MPRWIKRALLAVAILFILANVMAFLHARKFTHFDPAATARQDPSRLSFTSKIGILLTGVSLPRPVNKQLPDRPYEVVPLQSNKKIVCWAMKVPVSKGTVVLCHGYGGEKSDMLSRAYVFLDAGYNVLLPDFMGAGGSEGDQCTIGYKEAENVKTCVAYLQQKGEHTIYLMGTSMGAAAIMRACSIDSLPVKALILECPFASMKQTVKNRFEMVGVPVFPLAGFLVFWGGVQNGFNAFSHNPEDYAKQLSMPVLLLYGERDDRVQRFETDHIFEKLAGPKKLVTFPLAGHENYLNKYRVQWTAEVTLFLQEHAGQ